jgi:hypothetical protein
LSGAEGASMANFKHSSGQPEKDTSVGQYFRFFIKPGNSGVTVLQETNRPSVMLFSVTTRGWLALVRRFVKKWIS